MSARRSFIALAALAPAFAGCSAASYMLPHGGRMAGDRSCAPCARAFYLPLDADLSCAAFAIDGAEASPPLPIVDESAVEEDSVLVPLDAPPSQPTEEPLDETASDLPLIGPGHVSRHELVEEVGESVLVESLPPPLVDRSLPPPVLMESEEEAEASQVREAALALEAAQNVLRSSQRESTDVTIGLLPDSVERDPAPAIPTPEPLPSIEQPPRRLAGTVEPGRADYVNAPLAKLPRPGLLPHGRPHGGIIARPGLIAGIRHGLIGDREPPEPVPFVVYERVAPKFFPVPTRPAFEPALANYIVPASSGTVPSARPKTGGFAPPSLGMPPALNEDGTSEAETLPRSLPTMEALPLPQPGMELPPAPSLENPDSDR